MGERASIDSVLRDLADIAVRADALHRRGTMKPVDRGPKATAVGEARQLHVGSAMLAGSVLFDSAVEHYRGSFRNKAMFLALGSAAARLVAGIYGASREVPRVTSS